jgi:predicted dehydrogenase
MMTRALRWGVLSTAGINEKIFAAAAGTDRADVMAVASRSESRATAYAAGWNIPTAYGAYDDLLADDQVDAVYVSLPNGLHHEWTMRALRAGKHVLCEKPYSRWPAEVEEAFATARELGLVLSEAFMFRYHPQIVRLAELVLDQGVIGDLQLVTSSFSWPTETAGDVRLDLALGGGALLDVGVYCVSVGRLLAGEPLSVTAQQATDPTGVDGAFVATMQFASSVLSHFDCGIHLPDRSHLEVVGDLGSITVSDPWHCAEPHLSLLLRGEAPRDVPVGGADSYRLELEEFDRAVRGVPNRLLGGEDALGQARAVDALFRAADTGQRVAVERGPLI